MDKNLHNNVDKLFRESLQSSRQDVPETIWKQIEDRLDEEDNKEGIIYNKRKIKLLTVFFIFSFLAGGTALLKYVRSKQQSGISGQSVSAKPAALNAGSKPESHPVLTADLKPEPAERPLITPHETKHINPNMTYRYIALVEEKKTFNQNIMSFSPDQDPAIGRDNSNSVMNAKPVHLEPQEMSSINVSQNSPTAISHVSEKMVVRLQKQKFNRRFSITPYFSQEIAGYSLSDDDATAADGKEIEERERNLFSASVGLYLNYRLNKKWTLQSGISYSWSSSIIDSATSYAVKNNTGAVQFKLNTISGYGYLQPSYGMQTNVGDSVSTAKTYSELHYLSVPVILSYHIPLKRFSLLVGGGISLNMLTGASIETKTYGSGFPEKEYAVSMLGLKKINYGILVKTDLQYDLSSRIGVDLITSFKNTLSPINLKSALSAYPYNLGIGLGVTYHF